MPRQRRKVNKPLPTRWTFRHGAYYYRVPEGMSDKWGGKKSYYRLGSTLPEAFRTWADKAENPDTVESVSNLLDRFLLEVVPTKRPKTRESYQLAVKQLRSVFGNMSLKDIKRTRPALPPVQGVICRLAALFETAAVRRFWS